MNTVKKYRRQIKTTLSPDYELLLQKLCKVNGERESEMVRRILVKHLRTALSDEIINNDPLP